MLSDIEGSISTNQCDMHGNPIKGFTEENIKTKSGQFVVFHRERCPFVSVARAHHFNPPIDYDNNISIPQEFLKEKHPWFFMPSQGCNTPLAHLRGYPMIYSAGYATRDEALKQAEEWEKKIAERVKNGYKEPTIHW